MQTDFVYGFKLVCGYFLTLVMRKKTQRIKKTFTQPYWGKEQSENKLIRITERLIRYYLAYSDKSATGGQMLEHIHKDFWKNQIDDAWYKKTEQSFDKSLAALLPVVDKLRQFQKENTVEVVCEIGTGDGRFINYLSEVLDQSKRFVGLDICENRINYNKRIYDGVEFYGGDALEWITAQHLENTVYVTNGGVLEYFSPSSLDLLIQTIHKSQGCVALFYEPISVDHDLSSDVLTDLTKAGEYSFSHNYPAVFKRHGFDIFFESDNDLAGYRGLCLIAKPNQLE